MKKYFCMRLAITFLLILLSSCSTNDDKGTDCELKDYDDSLDIIQNAECLFKNAESALGDGAALLKIAGVQKSDIPGEKCDLNWICLFVKDNNQLRIDISNKKMTIVEVDEQLTGYEYLMRDDVCVSKPIQEIWKKCIEENKANLYSCEVYRTIT